jgi:hypothetical protein
VTISWDKRTLCQFDVALARDSKVHCRTMLTCLSSPKDTEIFSCLEWDKKNQVLNKFQITGCSEELGTQTCDQGLVNAACEKKNGVIFEALTKLGLR